MGAFDLNQAEFLFESVALGSAVVQVTGFRGHEELSRPFVFIIDLVSTRPDLPLDEPIGEPASLELRGRLPGTGARYSRFVHGIIERFELVRIGTRHHHYQATIVPSLLPLAYTRRSRIFQKMSTPDIVQAVLKGQIPGSWIEPMLHGKYGGRDYCVQYQESDLDFASRLLENDGIFYFFEHHKDKDVVALGDGKHAHAALPHFGELRHFDRPHLYEEGLFEFRAAAALRPGAVALRDFRFKHPGLDMEAKRSSEDRFARLEMYHFPGRYVDPGLGTQLAQIRLQEQQHDRYKFEGQSSCRDLRPGYTFQLQGHGRQDLNAEKDGYLIIAVEHQGSQPQALAEDQGSTETQPSYRARLVCIPARVPFRPPLKTPRPSISGIQTAVVVGPPSEEIHCDDHGRVKIQFHWDREGLRDDNSSCWVRVSQPWGGAGQGGMFIPRIGQEVIVQFLEGDPDRPLIVGRVYNGENPVPHGLPAAKNISSIRSASTPGGGGFNEMKFDDTAGSELVFFHAQKDQHEIVGNDHDVHVKNDQTEKVDNDRRATVVKNETLKVGVNQSLDVGGDQTNLIFGNRLLNVSLNDSETVLMNKALNVGLTYAIQVGAAMSTTVTAMKTTQVGAAMNTTVGGAMSTEVGAELNTTVGGAMTTQVGGAQTLTVGAVSTHTAGADMIWTASKNITGTAGVQFELLSGKTKIVLLNSGSKLTIQADSSTISMEPGKIKLDSGAGATIELDGSKIKLSAAEIEIDGSTKVEIKGGLINSEASGIQTIKGSLVKVNC